jgi:metal transporter CNNM
MAPFVLVLMWILAPVAWPTAKLLDYLLGEDHGTTYKKAGLKTLVTLHRTLGQTPGERLNQDEVTIISAVLDLKEKSVGSIMTPMADVFTLSLDTVLDEAMMDNILSEGYSRIPIYAVNNPRDFVGMLLVKMLITYDPEDALRVRDFQLATLPETRPETSCLDIVNFFQEGKSHMVLVSDFPGEAYGALGVVTLEDVIEELIGEEIIDESDVFIDVHKAVRRLHPAPFSRIRRVDKGEILTDPDPLVPDAEQEGLLEAYNKDQDVEGRQSPSVSMTESPKKSIRRQSTSEIAKSPPGTTFMMRRRSSGGEPLPIRSSNTDIRQHLKHLGPSNSASRPKATRIGTVHIKPGHVDTLAPLPETSQLALTSSTPPPAVSPRSVPRSIDANENTGLLSAGHSAKDGVHAVSYGAFTNSQTAKCQDPDVQHDGARDNKDDVDGKADKNGTNAPESTQDLLTRSPTASQNSKPSSSPNLSRRQSRSPDMFVSPPAKLIIDMSPSKENLSKLEASQAAGAAAKSDRDKRPISRQASSSTLASLHSIESSEERQKKRRLGARSGSISEHIIEVGGVKKVILETTSSSDGEEYANGGVSVGFSRVEDTTNGSSSKNPVPNDVDKDVVKEGDVKEGDAAKSAASKKKRRKKNHKKKGKGAGMGDSQTLTK